MQHTKGNWTVEIQPSENGTIRTINSGSNRIATLEFMPTIGESEANAKLIAAAPELLEALQNLVNLSYDTARPTKAEKNYGIDMAYNAIKKARGEN